MTPRELAAEHVPYMRNCVAKFTRNMPTWADLDEYESAAQGALVRAAQTYDPAKGAAFTSHAWRHMQGAMIDFQRKTLGRKHRNPVTDSLDRVFAGTEGLTLGDTIASSEDVFERVATSLDLVAALREFGRRERSIVMLRAAGVGQQQIAKHYDVTESRISQLVKGSRGALAGRLAA
jgi:RNA polymerase sigma factor (sigma-70 family)